MLDSTFKSGSHPSVHKDSLPRSPASIKLQEEVYKIDSHILALLWRATVNHFGAPLPQRPCSAACVVLCTRAVTIGPPDDEHCKTSAIMYQSLIEMFKASLFGLVVLGSLLVSRWMLSISSVYATSMGGRKEMSEDTAGKRTGGGAILWRLESNFY